MQIMLAAHTEGAICKAKIICSESKGLFEHKKMMLPEPLGEVEAGCCVLIYDILKALLRSLWSKCLRGQSPATNTECFVNRPN